MFVTNFGNSEKNVLKGNFAQRQSRPKVCNILATLPLLYGCEIWTLKQRDVRKLKTAENEIHETQIRI